MKKSKGIFFVSMLLLGLPALQSCLDDDENAYLFTELGTVKQTSEDGSTEPKLEGDVYGTSYVANREALKRVEADSIGQRVLYYFIEEEGTGRKNNGTKQYITIYDLYKVSTKPLETLPADGEDTFGHDPINILGAYVSNEHLNMQVQVRNEDKEIKHKISLVAAPGTTPDANGYIDVELRHSREGDGQGSIGWAWVSYTLESMPGYKEGTLKGLNITYYSIYDGKSTRKIEIKQTDSSSDTGVKTGAPNTKIK